MKSTASCTVRIFSASSSGISSSKASSKAITSSTVSSESAPRSSTNEALGVTSPSSTPNCSTMICFTLSSTGAIALLAGGDPHRLCSSLDCLCQDRDPRPPMSRWEQARLPSTLQGQRPARPGEQYSAVALYLLTFACFSTYSRTSRTVWIFSASSSEISSSNASSSAMTSSTWSRESAPRSSAKEELGVISLSSIPSCSEIICFTFSSVVINPPHGNQKGTSSVIVS